MMRLQSVKKVLINARATGGFTLVEMLIATSLFSVVILTATDIFIRVQRAQREAAVLEKTQDMARFFFTRLTQEIQSGSIDYEYYATNLQTDPDTKLEDGRISSHTLALRTAQGERLLFTTRPKGNTDFGVPCPTDDVSPCLIIATTSPTTQGERMNPSGTTIQKLLFQITPGRDPFAVDPTTNDFFSSAQPKVTVMLTTKNSVPGAKEPFTFSIQTTISTRDYRR